MKKKSEKSIYVFVFFITIYLGLFGILFNRALIKCGTKKSSINDSIIHWEEKYPFVEEKDISEGIDYISDDMNTTSISAKYTEIMSSLYQVGNKNVKYFWGYDQISKYGFILNSFISSVSNSSEYIQLSNGMWANKKEKASSDTYQQFAYYVSDLNEFLREKDIPFVYVMPPTKTCKYENLAPYGVTDYANYNLDLLARMLIEQKIDVVDLRLDLHEQGLKHEDMFYSSDHHWTVDSGLWATQVIGKKIEKYGFDSNKVNNCVYEKRDYGLIEFGSIGNAISKYNVKNDSFTVAYPIIEDEFYIEIPSLNVEKTGSFEQVMLDKNKIDEVTISGGGSAYGSLIYGNNAVTRIRNNYNKQGIKILVIKDSYALAMAPYIAIGCNELDLLDLRKDLNGFDGSVRSYIEEFDPDVVLLIYSWPILRSLR